MQPFMVFTASVLTLWAVLTGYFSPCGNDLTSDMCPGCEICPQCIPASLACTAGLKSWNDILRGIPIMPVAAFSCIGS